ncbi:TolC family outer membrane protein [Pelagibius litoralis]|uniref:TolC family outer membrane protein n=2 Tax=Pelagibius litoralis TaxID=374515 RepID=A0A967C710_9PROT|nr:TolC family outer membrane protein [Pelagibius litoralis]
MTPNPTVGLAVAAAMLAGLAFPLNVAQAQTLDEALVQAYQSNPTLSAARAELRSINERVPQALSNWRPFLEAQGSAGQATDSFEQPTERDGVGRSPVTGDLTLTQPLYRGGRTVAGTDRAENEVLAQRANLADTEQSVLFDAVSAFADVWRDQSVLELNLNNEQVLARQLEATQDRFEVGEVTRTDVAQSESRLSTATADRIQSQGNLTSSRATFENVVGVLPQILDQPTRPGSLPADQESVISDAEVANPAVLASQFTELAALRNVREVEGELLPEVNLQGQLSYQHEGSTRASESRSAEVLALVRVPLYQQGSVSSRVRESKQVASQRRLQVREALRQAREDAISAWESLETARAQIEAFQQSVRANEIALEGVRQENAVGARTVLDVLDAEQELLDAQVNLVGAQRDEVVASYQVLTAVGRLTAADLGLTAEIYDPETDYREVRDTWFGLTAPGAAEGVTE